MVHSRAESTREFNLLRLSYILVCMRQDIIHVDIVASNIVHDSSYIQCFVSRNFCDHPPPNSTFHVSLDHTFAHTYISPLSLYCGIRWVLKTILVFVNACMRVLYIHIYMFMGSRRYFQYPPMGSHVSVRTPFYLLQENLSWI